MVSGYIDTKRLWEMLHDPIVQAEEAIHEDLEREVTCLDQREKELA